MFMVGKHHNHEPNDLLIRIIEKYDELKKKIADDVLVPVSHIYKNFVTNLPDNEPLLRTRFPEFP